MRVGMVSFYYWPSREGGAEKQCRMLAGELAAQGMACMVYTARRDSGSLRRESHAGAQILRLPSLRKERPGAAGGSRESRPAGRTIPPSEPRRNGFRKTVCDILSALDTTVFMLALAKLVRKRPVDVLHVHSATSIAGYCAWLGARLGIPVIVKETSFPAFRSLDPMVPFNRVWDRWRRRAYCIAQHEAAAASLASRGVPPGHIRVIPNGIQVSAADERSEDGRTVLFVGNISQGIADKGLDVLIDAWGRVHRARPDLMLLLAGAGDCAPLAARAARLGCGNSIVFLGHVGDLAACYRKASLLLLPSRREGMSNVLLEAMNSGIAVIASDIPGNRAVISHRESGLLVPVGSADAMAEAALSIMRDSVLRENLGMGARLRIASRHDIAVVARATRSFYEHVVGP